MKGKYQFRYIETEEVLTDFLKVHGMTKISKNYKIVVFTGGVFVLLFMLVYSNVLHGTAGSIAFFALKYLVCWALAFVIAEVLARTFGKKMEMLASTGDGQTMYEERMKKWKEPFNVKLEFGKDSWTSFVHGNKQTLYYKNVERIIESEKIIAMIVYVETGGKKFFGFPKDGIQDADIDEFNTEMYWS